MDEGNSKVNCLACQGEHVVDGSIKGRLYFLPSNMFGGGYNMLARACLSCGSVWYSLSDADIQELRASVKTRG